MNVIIFADPQNPQPSRLNVMYPGLDTLEQSASKYLIPFSIPYRIVDSSIIPNSPFIYSAQTVDLSTPSPTFGWDLEKARDLAAKHNILYWQNEFKEGIANLAVSNYQIQLATATPPDQRTTEQVAIVEFMIGINGLQNDIAIQINEAESGEEIIAILSRLG
jgi:hypothetical protein